MRLEALACPRAAAVYFAAVRRDALHQPPDLYRGAGMAGVAQVQGGGA
jgi:hypothetical protein